MTVNFTIKDTRLLHTEMEALPRKDEMIVIDKVVYEILNVRHVFTPTRGGNYSYTAEVRIQPY